MGASLATPRAIARAFRLCIACRATIPGLHFINNENRSGLGDPAATGSAMILPREEMRMQGENHERKYIIKNE
jgi:hypothetical protein